MNRRDVFAELRDLVDLLEQAGLTRYSNSVIETPGKLNDFNIMSVTTARHMGAHTGPLGVVGENSKDFFYSLENYIASYRNGDFAVVLKDGALLQVRYDFDPNDLVGHRLCYFPLPCEIPSEFFEDFSPADILEMVVEQEPSRVRLRTPIRFDFSAYDTSSDPTVHLHLVTDEGRVPVFGPLSLGHFVDLVFRTFYPEDWERHRFLRDYKPTLLWRTIVEAQEFSLHLGCRH